MPLLSYRLDPPQEAEFLADALPGTRRVVDGLLRLAIVFHILLYVSYYAVLGATSLFAAVAAIRSINLIVAVAVLALIRRTSDHTRFHALTTICVVVLFAGSVAENALMPAEYTQFIAWDVFLVFSLYSAVPIPLERQVVAGLLLTIGDLVLLGTAKSLPESAGIVEIALAYCAANIVGAFVSVQLRRARRAEFVARTLEAAARKALEEALLEVRALRGIIPICSYCKDVRTDSGAWEQIERYVRAHSEANFSHGVCPTCYAERYPNLASQT